MLKIKFYVKNVHSLLLHLLSAWRAAGHTVGVDTYVRAMELLDKLPAGTPPGELKTLLAPLLASDKEQQTAFYALFDRLLPGWLARERAARRRRRWMRGMAAGLLLVLLALGAYRVYRMYGEKPGNGQASEQVAKPQSEQDSVAQTDGKVSPPTKPLPELPKVRDTLPLKTFDHRPDIGTLRVEKIPLFSVEYAYWDVWKTGGLLLWLAALAAAAWWLNRRRYRRLLRDIEAQRNLDTRATELKRGANDRPPFTWQFRWAGAADCYAEEDLAGITPRLRSRSAGAALLLDAPKTVLATVRDAGRINFRYRQPTQLDEYLLLIDIRSENDHRARLFDAIYQHLRRNEVHIERYFYRQDPRFCWNEHPQSATSLQDLHQRFPAHRLVVVGTGSALLSKIDGYLMPWAAVFDAWRYRTLLSTRPTAQWGAEEQTLATRFRLAPASLHGLADLVENVGVEENTDLNRWRKSTDDQADPIALPDGLAPATFVAALRAEYVDYSPDGPDERLFQWVAATALSPVLHWDATRFFAEAVEQHDPRPNQPLFTPRALQQLCRLPWFVAGRMPDNARRGLLQWLRTEQPDLLARLRAAWQQNLEQNLEYLRQQAQDQGQTPFEDTTAYEQLRLTMLVNELALDDLRLQMPPRERLQLERELRDLAKYTEPDIVALELLENAEAREATVMGADQEEVPPLPVWWTPLKWLWMLLLAGMALLFAYNGGGKENCLGRETRYRGTPICVVSPQDSLLYYEYLLCDTLGEASSYWKFRANLLINLEGLERTYQQAADGRSAAAREVEPALLLVRSTADRYETQWTADTTATGAVATAMLQAKTLIKTRRLDTTSFYRNTAIALWNAGAAHYNRNQTDSACIFFRNLLRWPLHDNALSAPELAFAATLCPEGDTDGDGTPDKDDTCPTDPGPADNKGCPDLNDILADINRSMIQIKGGTFRMGSDEKDKNVGSYEQPAHDVRLSDYYMGRTEVTNRQYVAFLNEKGNQEEGGVTWVNLNGRLNQEKCRIISPDGKTFSVEKGYENYPIIYVSWYGARAYCQWLSEKTGQPYRLPTEAEWEYAGRGGISWQDGFIYSGNNNLEEVGWYRSNSKNEIHPVAQKKSNQRGLYDMSGNVWEWCEDDWHGNYKGAPKDGRAWVEGGNKDIAVLRGGSSYYIDNNCRVANRYRYARNVRIVNYGFRLARAALEGGG